MVPGTIADIPGGTTLDNSEARSAEKIFSVGTKIFKLVPHFTLSEAALNRSTLKKEV